ncbi:MAG: hypothetical protein ACREV4_02805 [Gammaproteobacteria bacterium]
MTRLIRIAFSLSALFLFPGLANADHEIVSEAFNRELSEVNTAADKWGDARVGDEIASRITDLAGSEKNAEALVAGLRGGTAIHLTTVDALGTIVSKTTFTPPTGAMGWGNVVAALALTEVELAHRGIMEPTAEDVAAAMMGGTIPTGTDVEATMEGILPLWAQGLGWGEIAHSWGLQLGHAMKIIKARKDRQIAKVLNLLP